MEGRADNSVRGGARVDESSPLLSVGNSPHDVEQDITGTRNATATGFTVRRCMILPVFVCFCLAGGILTYAVPQYTRHRMVEKHKHDVINTSFNIMNDVREISHQFDCDNNKSHTTGDEVQKDTAVWSMYYTIASFIPAMLASLLWSSYSDILGRRFALIICCSGFTVRLGLFVVVIYFELSLVYMVLGAMVDGMCGSFMLLISSLYAYMSDITQRGKQRTIAIVSVELTVGLSFTVSSFTSGYIFTGSGYLYPMFACFCAGIFGIIILIVFVPETRYPDPAQNRSRNVFKVIGESLKFYCTCGTSGKRLKYCLLIFGLVFIDVPATSRTTMEVLYQLGRPFCWTSKKIGHYGSLRSLIESVTSMCGACLLRHCMADDTITTISIYLNCVSYIVEAFAVSDAVLYTVPLFAALSNLPLPMIRSLMSSLTPDDKQGVMYAGLGIIASVCALVGSVSNTAVYTATLSIMNGFVFLILAFLTFIGATFLLAFMYVNRTSNLRTAGLLINEYNNHNDSD